LTTDGPDAPGLLGRARRWLFGTHLSTDERIERLWRLAGDEE
jgi:hypothetical protein